MRTNPLLAYQETRLLTAQPCTLARIALEESIKEVRNAVAELRAGNVIQRSRSITKSINLLTEFVGRLDDRSAPEVCLNLKRVCDYAQRRLMEAHFKRSEAMMTEVIGLLHPIAEAWATVERRSLAAPYQNQPGVESSPNAVPLRRQQVAFVHP
jgi:flagellar biosynthetic protein FliS